MKYCVKCGEELPEGEVDFCPECGAKVSAPRSASAAQGTASASKRSSSKSASAVAAPEPPPPPPPPAPTQSYRVEPPDSGQRPPRGRRVALWIAWSLVGVLAAGNIFLGLYFGLGWDGKATADSGSTTTVVMATATTLAARTTTSTVGEPAGGTYSTVEDLAAQALVGNAMTAIGSAYVDTRTFDPTVMTPAVLQAVEPSITFVVGDASEDSPPDVSAADQEVYYLGNDVRFGVGTIAASGNSFAVVFDSSAVEGDGFTYFVNDQEQEW
jgi:hypothetical protein